MSINQSINLFVDWFRQCCSDISVTVVRGATTFLLRPSKSDLAEIWQDCSIEDWIRIDWRGSDFWYDVTLSRWRPCRHFKQKSAAICWVHCIRSVCAVHMQQRSPAVLYHFCLQFLIHGTFVLSSQQFVDSQF